MMFFIICLFILEKAQASLFSPAFDVPSFHVQTIPYDNKSADPFFLDFHMTRYFGGCFHEVQHETYNQIVPWIRNFDMIVTSCHIQWHDPLKSKNTNTCVWKFDNRDELVNFKLNAELQNEKRLFRVHVHSDRKHHREFIDRILPHFEKLFESSGFRFILHSGGGDSSVNHDFAERILDSKAVAKWVVEQSRDEAIVGQNKLQLLPIGLCPRETFYETGDELRAVLHEHNFTIPHHQQQQRRQLYWRRLLAEAQSAAQKPWHTRHDRVFFCFHEHYPWRAQAMAFARENCTICDVCSGELNHTTLWRNYASYKYVFSPHGNGPDCGKSWEIMLLGAVPLLEYFPGANGYLQAGLSALLIHDLFADLTTANLSQWNSHFRHHQHEGDKLSREYMASMAFRV